MIKIKVEKGITLIALIITIIILLILAVVTIGSIENSEIITYAQKAAGTYQEAATKEQILLDLQFKTDANGNMFSEENIDKIVEISKKVNIDLNKLTIYYDLKYKRSFVVYRYDLVTEDEIVELEKNGIKMLKGDVNFDGKLDYSDIKFYSALFNGEVVFNDKQKVVAEFDGLEGITINDRTYLHCALSVEFKLYDNWMKWEVSKKTGVSEDKLVEYYDEYTEKYYVLYRYDLVTEEERTKLEENGIKMLKGDLDFDGDIDGDDLQILNGYGDGLINVTEEQKEVGEMNNQAGVNASDATYLQKVISGNQSLYVEWEN